MDTSYLDCCAAPQVHTLRTLYESTHDLEALQQCTRCGTYWFYRFHEWVNWSGGEDDLTSWFTPLTAEEGRRLENTDTPNRIDLAFLADRGSWMDDRDGVRRVDHAPTHPYS